MKKLFVILAAMFLLVISSCGSGGGGGSDNHSTSPTSVNATGTWRGSYDSTVSGKQTIELNIKQENSQITGTYISSDGGTGTFSGSASGNEASLMITVKNPDCTGSLSGTGTIDTQTSPNKMSIQFNGSTACGGYENGTGSLEKQTATTVNAAGTWQGVGSLVGNMTLNIQQNRSAITGTFSTTIGGSGSLTGSVSGNTGTVTLNVTNPPECTGTLDVTTIVNTLVSPETMVSQYNGSLACTGNVSGDGVLEKQ